MYAIRSYYVLDAALTVVPAPWAAPAPLSVVEAVDSSTVEAGRTADANGLTKKMPGSLSTPKYLPNSVRTIASFGLSTLTPPNRIGPTTRSTARNNFV